MKMNDGLKVILFQEITEQHRNKLDVLVTEKEGLNLINSDRVGLRSLVEKIQFEMRLKQMNSNGKKVIKLCL